MENVNKKYTCPMHPEIISDRPGTCPKCHMALVPMNSKPKINHTEDNGLGLITWKSYIPLLAVISVIILATIVLTVVDLNMGSAKLGSSISYFMAGFFIVFAMFKLMDLSGFAEGYSTYDLLASKWKGYGYIYPFIELFFGLAMLAGSMSPTLLWAEIIVMGFSGLGVAIKIAKKEPFICACLGTFLKVPLTKVTLIEDFGMMVLGIIMLFIS